MKFRHSHDIGYYTRNAIIDVRPFPSPAKRDLGALSDALQAREDARREEEFERGVRLRKIRKLFASLGLGPVAQ